MIYWHDAMGSLAVALGVGLLVGMEREQSQTDLDNRRFGGVRTFALMALLGGLAGLIEPVTGWGVPAAIIAIIGSILVFHSIHEVMEGKSRGITTEVAALAVLFLGVLSTTSIPPMEPTERWGVVAACGTAVMALLSMRSPLHTFAKAISSAELYSTVKLGVLLLVIVPLLPSAAWGLGGSINPQQTGVMVALIAGLGFGGYLAVRLVSSKQGMAITGLLGGLISPKPVTYAFAPKAKEKPDLQRVASIGIALACVVTLVRIWVEVAVISPELLKELTPPLLIMATTGLFVTAISSTIGKKTDETAGDIHIRNPFSLSEAFKFAITYLILVTGSVIIMSHWGADSVTIIPAIGGAIDIDAATMTMARLFQEELSPDVAVRGIVVAASVSILAKGVLATKLGGRNFGLRIFGVLLPIVISGLVAVSL